MFQEWPEPAELSPAQKKPLVTEKWVYRTKAGLEALHIIWRFQYSCLFPGCTERGPHKHSKVERGDRKGTPFEDGYLVHLHQPRHPATEPQVVVCEGQKTAQSVAAIGHIGVSYIQGSSYAGKADYSPLAPYQRVLVAPDNDEAGQKAALESTIKLLEAGVQEVVVLERSQFPRNGGDLADLEEADRILAVLAPEGELYTSAQKATAHLAIHQFNAKSANLPGSRLELMDASEGFQLYLQTEQVWDGLIKHLVVGPMMKGQSPELYLQHGEIVSLFPYNGRILIRNMQDKRSKVLVSRGMFWHKGFDERELFSLTVDELDERDWFSVASTIWSQHPTEHGRIKYEELRRDEKGAITAPHRWVLTVPKSAYPNASVSVSVAQMADDRLPNLDGIIHRPMLNGSGDMIISESKYHQKEQVYLDWNGQLNIPDLETGLDELDTVFGEFPFENQASRTNFYACLLAGFIGMACSIKPLFLVNKSTHRAGATLLAELVSIILSNEEPVNAGTMGSKDDETNGKRISSAAYRSSGVVLMDNIAGSIDSAELATYVTSAIYSARKLGSNTDQMEISRRPLVDIATSVNPTLTVELLKRTVNIRIDPKMEDPSKRTFKLEDVKGYVTENRERVVGAILSLIQHWLDNGAPTIKSKNVMGGFEQWRNLTNSILVTCGFSDFLENIEEAEERMASDEASAEKELVRFWLEKRGYYGVTASELALLGAVGNDDNIDQDIVPLGSGKYHGRLIKFGTFIKNMEGKVYEFEDGTKVRLERTGHKPGNKIQYWLVQSAPEDFTDECTIECGWSEETGKFEHGGGCTWE